MSTVFSIFYQILKLIPRADLDAAVRRHGAERNAKGFSSWGQFVAMLFCRLGSVHSLRDIVNGLTASEGKLRHPGLPAATVAEIYRNRWQIELFFKALKQSCKMKTFVGTSANALKTQIWTALISMLLVKILHMRSSFGRHFSNFIVLLRQQLFIYRDLWKWIDDPVQPPQAAPSPRLELTFD